MYKTPIIPINPIYFEKKSMKQFAWKYDNSYTLDHKAISTFCAFGFMLEDDTYYKEIKVIKPAMNYKVDENNCI